MIRLGGFSPTGEKIVLVKRGNPRAQFGRVLMPAVAASKKRRRRREG